VADRLVVFIDYQNVYKGARDAFFTQNSASQEGQIHPKALARRIEIGRNSFAPTELKEVRVYRGMPDGRRDSKGYSASSRQTARWERSGITVKNRPLKYPPGWPEVKAQEKGVDVQLAIDYVAMAINDEYDVGVLVSCDTDLRPALEVVMSLGKKVEVAAWRGSNGRSPRLTLPPPANVWCHWMDIETYGHCSDPTDYGKPI
jgi:uncharacterized LabA/DUF88 family protein